MKVFAFEGVLTETGWLEPAWVTVDERGHLLTMTDQPPPQVDEIVPGFAIPGFQNAHSHAFQYAMAGLAEHLSGTADDFWSWRQAMYGLALHVDPDTLEAIAAMLYSEMLRHGYTAVAEFHYLHHDPNGKPYADPAEMGTRLVAAAKRTGIAITLIPIFYRLGNFGIEASPHQRRFLTRSRDAWDRLVAASARAISGYDRARLGIGVHSLRAADSDDLHAVWQAAPADAPRHLHIAEQRVEVEACLAHLGARPVAWLMDNLDLGPRDNLVHATHIDAGECAALAASGATAVLCPTTEGNLGDGFFPLRDYVGRNGSWAIGSDSHIGLNPMEELRWIDYGQRLQAEQRNVLCHEPGQDSGWLAYTQSLLGGRRALGQPDTHFFPLGAPFDAAILDASWPLFATHPPERRLATLIYAGDAGALLGTMTAAQWVVREGKHRFQSTLRHNFTAALAKRQQAT